MLESYATRYIASLRRAERTREEYARDLGLFVAWAKKQGKDDPRQITSAEIEEFLKSLVRKDGIRYAAVSRNRVLAVVKGYYKFLVKDRLIAPLDDPASLVATQKRPRRAPIFLELDEGARIILGVRERVAESEFQQMMKARDMAILTLLLGSGLRISELVALNVDTWREAMMSGWLTVVGKGDKERIVPPSDEAVEYVQKYLRVRPEVPPDPEGRPLFVSRKNGRLSRFQIERLVKGLAQEAGITKKITPHKLRATWVTQLLISGANPREVQKLAGHESLDTTMIYAGVRDNEELRRVVKKHQVRYM
ncbi:MAG TPA: tyrosine-type recombinase/integrase [Symbiobacteriaceae bacterium]|nr:tyrosine-type recombinase/integrase [Symbiobacteriaceae bacterium]